MVLACSRHMFVRPTLVMDQAEWTAAHVEAFAFFGGVPARLVPDNLKTGVDKPDLYDPKINRSYAELAAHYGTLVDPARAFKPKDKPQVERPMPYVRDSFWRGREFTSLAEMRAAALVWCRDVAGAGRVARWRARPRPRCSPPSSADAAAVAGRAVRAGHLVERAGRPGHPRQRRRDALLGAVAVPRRPARRPLHAESMVQLFHHGQLIKTHPRKDRGKQTDLGDYPPEKIAFHMRTPTWLAASPLRHGTRSPDRETTSIARRTRRARFEQTLTLEGFDFTAAPKLPAAQIRDLAALRWLQAGESVILHGPVGVGKTHVAQALAHLAIRAGAEARFVKTSRVLAELAGGHADGTWTRRLRELARPAVLVLDDFAMRELTPTQADDLYELINERAGRSLILTSQPVTRSTGIRCSPTPSSPSPCSTD